MLGDQSENYQLATFAVEGLRFGINVMKVQEVLPFHETTPVPLSPPTVTGLINLRGIIISTLDLATILQMTERSEPADKMNIIVRAEDETFSLIVHEIGDVIQIARDRSEPPPATLEPTLRDYITGIFKLPGELLLELDVDKIAEARTNNCANESEE